MIITMWPFNYYSDDGDSPTTIRVKDAYEAYSCLRDIMQREPAEGTCMRVEFDMGGNIGYVRLWTVGPGNWVKWYIDMDDFAELTKIWLPNVGEDFDSRYEREHHV